MDQFHYLVFDKKIIILQQISATLVKTLMTFGKNNECLTIPEKQIHFTEKNEFGSDTV